MYYTPSLSTCFFDDVNINDGMNKRLVGLPIFNS